MLHSSSCFSCSITIGKEKSAYLIVPKNLLETEFRWLYVLTWHVCPDLALVPIPEQISIIQEMFCGNWLRPESHIYLRSWGQSQHHHKSQSSATEIMQHQGQTLHWGFIFLTSQKVWSHVATSGSMVVHPVVQWFSAGRTVILLIFPLSS